MSVKTWRYNEKTQKFECQFAGCDYEHDQQAGVQMHSLRVHDGKGGKSKTGAGAKPVAGADIKPSGGGCEHDYRMLAKHNEIHVRAMRAGFVVFCSKCNTLK